MASGLCRNELRGNIREPECLAMKRPGKPDTGNPFVRFDEERGGSAGLTTTVGSTRPLPLCLLYRCCAQLANWIDLPRKKPQNSELVKTQNLGNVRCLTSSDPGLGKPQTAAVG